MPNVCEETKNRIRVALFAYAYEIQDDPLISDGEFDELCEKIDLSVFTGNTEMDMWFIEEFTPHTGQWIHNHPGKDRLHEIYKNIKDNNETVSLEDMF